MNDLELAGEIERGELVIAAANSQHRYVPLEIKDQIIAALRRGPEHDKEIGEFQQSVYAICEKFYPEVDGAGSDTGDWRDFTLAEIRQTLNHLAERPPSGEMVMVPRELTEEDVRNISKEFIKNTPSGMRLDAVIRRVHSALTAFQPCRECGSPQRCYRLGACRLSNLLSAAEASKEAR